MVVLTLSISWWKQKKTVKEGFIVFGQVLITLAFLLGVVFGMAELLVSLGIAQSGFIIKGEELK